MARCGIMVMGLTPYASNPSEFLVGLGCLFTVLTIQIGLCDAWTHKLKLGAFVLIYPGSCRVEKQTALKRKFQKLLHSLRIKIKYIVYSILIHK